MSANNNENTGILLDEFIATEFKRLAGFAREWRASNVEKGSERFPMSFYTEAAWMRHYLAYSAHQIESAINEALKEAKKAA